MERTFVVPAISCVHCQRSIEAEVANAPGVEQVTVDVAERTVRVVGDASSDTIRAAIVDAGYEPA